VGVSPFSKFVGERAKRETHMESHPCAQNAQGWGPRPGPPAALDVGWEQLV